MRRIIWTSGYPRPFPSSISEWAAFRAYKRRGFAVELMPYIHPFDFTVNGVRVDVKMVRANKGNPNHFASCEVSHDGHPQVRCDLFHVICYEHEADTIITHFFIPSQELDGMYRLSVCRDAGDPTAVWEKRWDLLTGDKTRASVEKLKRERAANPPRRGRPKKQGGK